VCLARALGDVMRAALLAAAAILLFGSANGQGIFDAFFNGGGQQRQRRGRGGKPKGNDMTVELGIELADVYNGATREAQLSGKRKICEDCKGTGARGGKTTKCQECGGQGQVSKPMRMGPMMVQMQQPCGSCGGKGVTYKHKCPVCNGNGIIPDNKALKCVIEPGMLSGDELKFDREASVDSPDIDPGDLIFKLKVDESHSKFKRQEVGLTNDLRMTDQISLREALLGFEHQVQHMDNHIVQFGHRGVTQPYQLRNIQGEGMPIRGARGQQTHGDLIIEHRVKFPSKISSSQRETLLSAFGGYPISKAESIICAAPPCTLD